MKQNENSLKSDYIDKLMVFSLDKVKEELENIAFVNIEIENIMEELIERFNIKYEDREGDTEEDISDCIHYASWDALNSLVIDLIYNKIDEVKGILQYFFSEGQDITVIKSITQDDIIEVLHSIASSLTNTTRGTEIAELMQSKLMDRVSY